MGRWIRENPRRAILIAMAALVALALVRVFTGTDAASLMQRTDDARAYFALIQQAEGTYYTDNGRYTESVAELTSIEPGVGDAPSDVTLELETGDAGETVTLTLEGLTVRLGGVLTAGEPSSETCEITRRRAGFC